MNTLCVCMSTFEEIASMVIQEYILKLLICFIAPCVLMSIVIYFASKCKKSEESLESNQTSLIIPI